MEVVQIYLKYILIVTSAKTEKGTVIILKMVLPLLRSGIINGWSDGMSARSTCLFCLQNVFASNQDNETGIKQKYPFSFCSSLRYDDEQVGTSEFNL